MLRQSLPKHAVKHTSASYRIRTYRCYFSIDREVGSLRAYPSARLCERNRISGLKRLQEIDDLLFTAGRHESSRTASHRNNGPFSPLLASLRGELSDNVAMGRRKLFTREDVLNKTIPVFWKHGLAETSVQDLEQATECANPACMQSSRTKRTCLSQACANILTCCGTRSPDEAAFGLGQRRGLSQGLLRELGTEGVLFRELHARVCGSSPQSPPDHDCEYDEGSPAPDRQSNRCTWRGRR